MIQEYKFNSLYSLKFIKKKIAYEKNTLPFAVVVKENNQKFNVETLKDTFNKNFDKKQIDDMIKYYSIKIEDFLSFVKFEYKSDPVFVKKIHKIYGFILKEDDDDDDDSYGYSTKLRKFREKMKILLDSYEKITTIPSETILNVSDTSLKFSKVVFETVVYTDDDDNYEIFNSLHTSPDIPFICINKFFKYLKGFVLQNELIPKWKKLIYTPENNIHLQINRSITNKPNYCEVIIEPDFVDKKSMRISINIDMTNDVSKNIDINEIKGITKHAFERLKDNFTDGKNLNSNKNDLSSILLEGYYYVHAPSVKYIWTKVFLEDFIVNDKYFSKWFILNETYSSKKNENSISIVFNYNDDHDNDDNNDKINKIDHICFKIEQKIIESKDVDIINLNSDKFIIGTVFWKISFFKRPIKQSIMHNAQMMVFSMLVNYFEKEESISDKYSKYFDIKNINSFKKQKFTAYKKFKNKNFVDEENSKSLKKQNPLVFPNKYARFCSNPPIILSKNTNVDYNDFIKSQENGEMLFPKTKYGNIEPVLYSCAHNLKYKFPSLKENTIDENKDILSVLPCCLTTDQNKKNTLWYKYYIENKNLNNLIEKNKKSYTIEANTILDKEQSGKLHNNVKYFFSSQTYETDTMKYVREGMTPETPDSIIEALLKATNLKKSTTDVRNDLVKLLELNHNIISQDCYDYTIDAIKKYLQNFERYIDYRLFKNLLESYFNCNIFVFETNDKFSSNILLSPRYIHHYVREHNYIYQYENTVLINKNTFVDKKYPQYDLIFYENDKKDKKKLGAKKYIFSTKNDPIIKQINKLYENMYLINKELIIHQYKTLIIGEYTDYYGKTRYIKFKDVISNMESSVWLITDPLPPLYKKNDSSRNSIKLFPVESVISSTKDIADIFIKNENIENHTIIYNKRNCIIGYSWTYYKINYYLPIFCNDKSEIDSSSIQSNYKYPTSTYDNSPLDEYNLMSKLARYSIEYLLYLYSHNYEQYKGKTSDFINNFVLVDETFQYQSISFISRKFNITDSPLVQNNKLIVQNTLIKKKLEYVLNIRLRNNQKEIETYKNRKYLKDYYIFSTDFIPDEKEYILSGEESFDLIQKTESQKQN